MASLPKHFTASPSLVHADIHLTVDGGDIRDDAIQSIWLAIEEAIVVSADKVQLTPCISRRLRSTDGKRLRRQLQKQGFRIAMMAPPVPPVSPKEEQ